MKQTTNFKTKAVSDFGKLVIELTKTPKLKTTEMLAIESDHQKLASMSKRVFAELLSNRFQGFNASYAGTKEMLKTLSYTYLPRDVLVKTEKCGSCGNPHKSMKVVREELQPNILVVVCPVNHVSIEVTPPDAGNKKNIQRSLQSLRAVVYPTIFEVQDWVN